MKLSAFYLMILVPGLLLPTISAQTATVPSVNQAQPAPKVQVAMLLDTSGSMQGLIAQAKTQLWNIVNEFLMAKQGGVAPEVHVALYEYGKDSLNKENHWIRQIQPFTRDMDAISRDLFALNTNGGEEYCGAVIRKAVDELSWDDNPKTYKAIFIAGNEPFTQGPVDAEKSSLLALRKGIVVNTLHCGDEATGKSTGWQQGAALANGKFFAIDQNQVVAVIDAPQDMEIVKLNTALNGTYIPFGVEGMAGRANQVEQDTNAGSVGNQGVIVSRAMCKASHNYCNGRWDAVDAMQQGKIDITALKVEELPAEMKDLKPSERLAYIEKKASERKALQEKILNLSKEREVWLVAKRREQPKADTLESAVQKAIQEQAGKFGFVWMK